MKVLSTDGLTKLIQLIKGAFISVDDTVTTNSITLATVATSGDYEDLTNTPTNLANKDLSNLSSTGEAHFQAPLVSGTNIKTIDNTSILGSGNIDTDNVYWATYGTTTFTDIMTAINAGKLVLCRDTVLNNDYVYTYRSHTSTTITFYNASSSSNTIVIVDNSNNWDMTDATFLPDQTSQSGKFLTTNGTTASWATVNAIKKFSLAETYALNDIVVAIVDDNVALYRSLTNNNVGHNLDNETYWEKQNLGGNGYEIADLVWRLTPTQEAGKHLLDGTLLPGSGIYGGVVSHFAELYEDNPNANYFTDETEWQSTVTTYGSCGKFVYDSTNNTLRLPKVSDILQGTTDLNAVGDLIEAGLPNILASVGTYSTSAIVQAFGEDINFANGAFGNSIFKSAAGIADSDGSGQSIKELNFDASLSNPIYDNSNTVQPQAIKGLLYIVIANSMQTQVQVDINNIATDLNNKADRDLSNTAPAISFATAMDNAGIRTVVETYINGSSWYRVYSDGWCVQGGKFTAGADTTATLTLLKPYRDTLYQIGYCGCNENSNSAGASWINQMIYPKTTSTATYRIINYTRWWQACGYIR